MSARLLRLPLLVATVATPALLFVACGSGEPGPGEDAGGGGQGGNGSGGSTGWEAIGCETRSTAEATTASGTLDEDTTWSGIVRLEGTVIVSGATLTIEDGTEIVADAGSELLVSDEGAIVAEGSEETPIRFCGKSDQAGSWRGISIEETAAESALHYVLVADGGGEERALAVDAATLVDHVRVENSGSDGVHASIFADESTTLSVGGAADVAVVLTHARAITPFPADGAIENNGDDSVHLRFEEIDVDTTFGDLGVPWVVEESVLGRSGTVRILEGTHFLLEQDARLSFGYETQTLFVEGTAQHPVLVEGTEHTQGHHSGVLLGFELDLASRVDHLIVRDASSGLTVAARVRVSDITLENNRLAAELRAQGVHPDSAGLTIRGSVVPLRVEGAAVFGIPEPLLIEDSQNGVDRIHITEALAPYYTGVFTEDGTLPDLGYEYALSGAIEIRSDVTIPAGLFIAMGVGNSLRVLDGGRLTIEGTEEEPVVMGEAEFGLAAPHDGIVFESDADPTSSISHLRIDSGTSCVILGLPISITDTSFTGCEESAVLADSANDEADYTNEFSNLTVDGAAFDADNSSHFALEAF